MSGCGGLYRGISVRNAALLTYLHGEVGCREILEDRRKELFIKWYGIYLVLVPLRIYLTLLSVSQFSRSVMSDSL